MQKNICLNGRCFLGSSAFSPAAKVIAANASKMPQIPRISVTRAPLAIISVNPLIAHFCGRNSAMDCINFGSMSIGQYIPLTIHVAMTNKLPNASCCSGVLTLAAIINPMPTTVNRKSDTNTITAAGFPQLMPNSQWVERSNMPN